MSLKKVDLCGGSPALHSTTSINECPNLEHDSIISISKMSYSTFERFAMIDIARHIESIVMIASHWIQGKLNAIPKRIADPDTDILMSF